MRRHGVHFQPSLAGTLHLSRTNAFFMGGGKALVNAYYRSAERLGVQVRYAAPVARVEQRGGRFVAAVLESGQRIEARACVLAAGGFESNLAWLREAWGRNHRGEWPADNFAIRGTRFNQGVLLKDLIAQGADAIGDPTQAHMVAIDARAPLYDGGICTRVDCVSLGIVVNREGQRFYDEGEDFWPKRYALWGRLAAMQPAQVAHSIIDAKAVGRFMPPVFRGAKARTLRRQRRAQREGEAMAQRPRRSRVPRPEAVASEARAAEAEAAEAQAAEAEVARQLQICNACRYCEGYCAVFPAMTRRLEFPAADVHFLANLCHQCGACLHACQYAPPHEFAVNVPQATARVRVRTYAQYAWPPGLGRLYERNGVVLALALAAALSFILAF
jgi:ferredoxin